MGYNARMVSVTRERIALIVFVLLVLVGIGCLVAYINIGHNWNVTATTIDDATGELDGYTVILYQGVVLDEKGEDDVPDSSSEVPGDESGEKAGLEDAEIGGGSEALGASALERGDETVLDGPAEAGSGQKQSDRRDDSKGSSAANSGGAVPLFNGGGALDAEESKPPVDVDEAAASYEGKGASVLVLDLSDSSKYDEGTILKRGDRRIGVFSVKFNEPLPKVQAKVDYLKSQSVDFVVAITPDKFFVQKATGVDVVISAKSEGLFFMGETIDGTFYTDSPLVTQVGAVLISPHNVVSSRDIDEL